MRMIVALMTMIMKRWTRLTKLLDQHSFNNCFAMIKDIQDVDTHKDSAFVLDFVLPSPPCVMYLHRVGGTH